MLPGKSEVTWDVWSIFVIVSPGGTSSLTRCFSDDDQLSKNTKMSHKNSDKENNSKIRLCSLI